MHHAVELSGAAGRPRVVHLGTASGDQRWFNAELDEAAAVAGFDLRHLNLRRVWQAGVVLAGVSAGSICWHVGGTTDSFGPQLRPVTDGLALLPFGNGVHDDSEAERRPLVHRLVVDGVLPTTHCTVPRKREVPPDGVGLVYRGTELVEAVTEVTGRGAYTVTRDAEGRAVEERLEPRALPGAR